MARTILANSPGWKLTGPIETQMRAPLISRPMTGNNGSTSRPMPSSMKVYRYCSSILVRRTTTRVPT
jgi:hypothetical protein